MPQPADHTIQDEGKIRPLYIHVAGMSHYTFDSGPPAMQVHTHPVEQRVLLRRLWLAPWPMGFLGACIKCVAYVPGYSKEPSKFIRSTGLWKDVCCMQSHLKVSEREACAIGQAFWAEFGSLGGASKVLSAGFLQQVSGLHRTCHENSLTDLCESYGMRTSIQLAYVPVDLNKDHPILRVTDVIRGLSTDKKLHLLFAGHGPEDYLEFWKVYRQKFPGHKIFETHQDHLQLCIPVQLHMDEGTSIKKKGLMVIHWGPCMGAGTSRNKGHLNFLGNSIRTRFLHSCMMAKLYGGKRKNRPLLLLTEHLAKEFQELFYKGVEVEVGAATCKIYPVCINLKADWAGLAKVGSLKRSFMSDAPTKPYGRGVCHLCRGGMEGHPWHKVGFAAMARAHEDPPLPWTRPCPLIAYIPGDPSRQPEFFRVDVFHTCHKGIVADAAANAVEPRTCTVYTNFWQWCLCICLYTYIYL